MDAPNETPVVTPPTPPVPPKTEESYPIASLVCRTVILVAIFAGFGTIFSLHRELATVVFTNPILILAILGTLVALTATIWRKDVGGLSMNTDDDEDEDDSEDDEEEEEDDPACAMCNVYLQEWDPSPICARCKAKIDYYGPKAVPVVKQ